MQTTLIQIRSVPVEVHRRLKIRAATEGVTMSQFALRELRKALDRPSRAEILERLTARPVRRLRTSAASIVREARDAR